MLNELALGAKLTSKSFMFMPLMHLLSLFCGDRKVKNTKASKI